MTTPKELSLQYDELFRLEKSYKIAFSLKDLVQLTSDFSVKNAKGCNSRLMSSDPKKLFLKYKVTCNLKGSDPNGHEVKLRFDTNKVDKNSGIKNLDVKVTCSCPAFLYWGSQWNLGQGDSLEGNPRPLYQAPTEPERFQNVICKHIKIVADRIGPYLNGLLNKFRDEQVEKILDRYEDKTPEEVEEQIEEEELDKELEKVKPKLTPKEKALLEMQGPEGKKEKKKKETPKIEPKEKPEEVEEEEVIEPTVKPKLTPREKALNEMQGPSNKKPSTKGLNITKPVIE